MAHFPQNVMPAHWKDESLDIKGNKFIISAADYNKHDTEIRAIQMYLGPTPASVPGKCYSGMSNSGFSGQAQFSGFSLALGCYPPPECSSTAATASDAFNSIATKLAEIRDGLVLVTSGTVAIQHPLVVGTNGLIVWPTSWPKTTLVTEIPDDTPTADGDFPVGQDDIDEISLASGANLNEDGGFITIINDVSLMDVTIDSKTILIPGYTSMAVTGTNIYSNTALEAYDSIGTYQFRLAAQRVFSLGTNVEILSYASADVGLGKIFNVKRRQFGTTSTRHAASDLVFVGRLSLIVSPSLYLTSTEQVGQAACLLRSNGRIDLGVSKITTTTTTTHSGQNFTFTPSGICGGFDIRKTDDDSIYFTVPDADAFGLDGALYKFDSTNGVQKLVSGMSYPLHVTVDELSGDCYMVAWNQQYVIKYDAGTQIIAAYAGIPSAYDGGGFGGDGGAATSAQLNTPWDIALDSAGDLYISDYNNHRIRKVDSGTGIITTVVGTGVAGFSGDGAAPAAAQINSPTGIAFDDDDNLYICDKGNNRLRKVDFGGNTIVTYAGDGGGAEIVPGPATASDLPFPESVTIDGRGFVYVSIKQSPGFTGTQIAVIDSTNEEIAIYAGTGHVSTVPADGTPRLAADMNPNILETDSNGNLLFIDFFSSAFGYTYSIQKIDLLSGLVSGAIGPRNASNTTTTTTTTTTSNDLARAYAQYHATLIANLAPMRPFVPSSGGC